MILLDTNVVSEAIKLSPSPEVLRWLDSQPAESLYVSSVTIAELLFGIGALPSSKRKTALTQVVEGVVTTFTGRILTFDAAAARCYAELACRARANGRGFPTPDGYIAAIAGAQGFTIATRDTAPFEAVGLPIINPWMAEA